LPAAMFMVKVHTLSRHLASELINPVQMLTRLNEALAAQNHSGLFVTMTQGVYDPRTGDVVLASGAHPLPLLRRVDGTAEEVPVRGRDGKKQMFGEGRLREVIGGPRTAMSLKACAEETRRTIERFTSSPEQQDDLTLLLLRRQ